MTQLLQQALAEVQKLPASEQDAIARLILEKLDCIARAQEILDSIAAPPEPLPLTEAQKQEFDRRLAELDANPNNVLTWEEIKARILGQP
jgi:putative addiction module component (TIGR02574 family)